MKRYYHRDHRVKNEDAELGLGVPQRGEGTKFKELGERPTPVEWKRFNWAGGMHGR